jgi:hypothetical protein
MARMKLLVVVTCLVTASVCPVTAQTQPSNSQAEATTVVRQRLPLSPEATQVADEIGITSLLNQLARIRTGEFPMSFEELVIRQQITEKVLAASLDVDSVNAIIDAEIEQIRSIRSDLQSQRDKAQNIINVASIVTGGALGVVNTALQFKSSTANLGNGIGVGGGAASVVLSIVGIRKQKGGKHNLADSPRMLARFFGRQPGAPESIKSDYPEVVWSYLNSPTPSESTMVTRKEQLIAKWKTEGRIKRDGSPSGQRQIEALSNNISQMRRLNIDELSDRVAMLLDVRARVSLMKRDLAELMRSIQR